MVDLGDEHACRVVTAVLHEDGMRVIYRIACRCGYRGEWRRTRYAAFDDRLAHRRQVLSLRPPAADPEPEG